MSGSTWNTAPADYGCCYRCKRYLHPEKLDGNACVDGDSCRRSAARNNRAKRRSLNQILGRPVGTRAKGRPRS